LHEILGPPHGSGLHQVPPEQPGPPEAQHLRRKNYEQRHHKRHGFFVENLDGANDVDGVHVASTGVREDRDQHVLFHVERAGIERELPRAPPEEHSARDRRGHEVAERDHRDLSRYRRDRERLSTVPEELVEEGEEDAC
jgi:hypothetical protein